METNHVDFTQQSPVILSFCPGIRGLERGLERVFREVRTCAYVEIETFIVENLLAAMEEGLVASAPVWTNLKTFDPRPFRGTVDGIIGGYPCQPFSHAGNRKGTDDPRHLWPFIRRHIEVIQPGWCFFENVAGHLTLGFDVIKRELEEMGYWVEAGIYSAEEVGAPQRRERLYILAVRLDVANSSCDGGTGVLRNIPETDAGITRPEEQYENPSGKPDYASSDDREDVANSNSYDTGGGTGNVLRKEGESVGQENKRKWDWNEHSPCREAMANPDIGRGEQHNQGIGEIPESGTVCTNVANGINAGLQGRIHRREDTERGDIAGHTRCSGASTYDRWPAGQGPFQYDWEEPRTIESSMVYTINGYNFTEDLHRAIGNSVVEQTAEFAFRDLYRKMHDWFAFAAG